ncbi:hypothetical protein LINPERPRIM_LOCUS35398 [Linum perenne]
MMVADSSKPSRLISKTAPLLKPS